ncbi:MAG TPA: FAD binding domain-containing protein [Verrucomicrobiae bacterium]|nr:FAD binding domain-containing protein [Verrucomicrobiae bacterium]
MFYQPKSIGEALELKAELKESGAFIAGGTDLVVLMNRGIRPTENFIDLSHVKDLTAINKHNGTLELAGNVTFAQAGRLPIRCLAKAALSVGGPGIRELGTLAGNLATASPAGDGSTALLALDAEVELSSARGVRRLPLDKFFLSYRKTALASDEMITKIKIPTNYQTDWAKNGKRGAVNISVVAVAVAIAPGLGSGGATVPVAKHSTTASQRLAPPRVRIALASVAPTPMRCHKAEEFLAKNGLDTGTIRQAVEIVRSEIKPITDHRASADYKVHLAGVLVRRLLEKLVKA